MHTVIPPAGSGGRAPSDSAIEIRADQIVHWIGITVAPIAVGLLVGVLLREHAAGRFRVTHQLGRHLLQSGRVIGRNVP